MVRSKRRTRHATNLRRQRKVERRRTAEEGPKTGAKKQQL